MDVWWVSGAGLEEHDITQVDDLLRIAILQDVPVIAYGIRTDFQTVAFPGSRRLLEIAHSLEEMKTICRCGRKAVFNARQVGERFIFAGDQVAIDGADVTYMSLCGACYLAESGGALSSGRPVEAAPQGAESPQTEEQREQAGRERERRRQSDRGRLVGELADAEPGVLQPGQ